MFSVHAAKQKHSILYSRKIDKRILPINSKILQINF